MDSGLNRQDLTKIKDSDALISALKNIELSKQADIILALYKLLFDTGQVGERGVRYWMIPFIFTRIVQTVEDATVQFKILKSVADTIKKHDSENIQALRGYLLENLAIATNDLFGVQAIDDLLGKGARKSIVSNYFEDIKLQVNNDPEQLVALAELYVNPDGKQLSKSADLYKFLNDFLSVERTEQILKLAKGLELDQITTDTIIKYAKLILELAHKLQEVYGNIDNEHINNSFEKINNFVEKLEAALFGVGIVRINPNILADDDLIRVYGEKIAPHHVVPALGFYKLVEKISGQKIRAVLFNASDFSDLTEQEKRIKGKSEQWNLPVHIINSSFGGKLFSSILKQYIGTNNAKVISIDPEKFIKLVNEKNIPIIDIREQEELDKKGKIEGNVLWIAPAFSGADYFTEDFWLKLHNLMDTLAQQHKLKTVFIACANNVRAQIISGAVAKIAASCGIQTVGLLSGGVNMANN